jgi:hypothetical protein
MRMVLNSLAPTEAVIIQFTHFIFIIHLDNAFTRPAYLVEATANGRRLLPPKPTLFHQSSLFSPRDVHPPTQEWSSTEMTSLPRCVIHLNKYHSIDDNNRRRHVPRNDLSPLNGFLPQVQRSPTTRRDPYDAMRADMRTAAGPRARNGIMRDMWSPTNSNRDPRPQHTARVFAQPGNEPLSDEGSEEEWMPNV